MPRRQKPHPFARRIGARIRRLRKEAGLTIEKLAYESDLGSKGHLSSLERGLVVPTVETLRVLAERLGVLPLDLVTFPEDSPRERLVEASRKLSRREIEALLVRVRKTQ